MILGLYAGAVALFWLIVWLKTESGRRDPTWRLGPASPVAPDLPRLAVIVPARDEAAHIGACVAALRASDHPGFEVFVFDDASSDGTARLAAEAGATVLAAGPPGPLPEGWKGKPWALQRAVFGPAGDAEAGPRPELAGFDAYLFLDADVRVHPAALSRAHTRLRADGADFLSGFGTLTMLGFWEKVIQPSVGALILGGNDLPRINGATKVEHVIANGQFILMTAAAYRALGGHAAVRADILDDVGLARAAWAKGQKLRVLMMRELFSCRMYTNLRELWLGWSKNLYAGLHHRPLLVVLLIGMMGFNVLSPYFVALGGLLAGAAPVAWTGLGLVLLLHLVRLRLDGLFDQDRRYGLLQPLGTVMLMGLLVESMRRSRGGTVVWKGRTYAVTAAQDTMRNLPPKEP